MTLSPTPPSHRWLLIRGLARHHAHWGEFLKHFREAHPEAEVEFLDTAGNGTEIARSSFQSISENVTDLRSRSTLLKNGPVNLLAISLGGMIATEWMQSHPEEISRAVLINTSNRSSGRIHERLLPTQYYRLTGALLSSKNPSRREKLILDMVSNLPSELRATWAEKFARESVCSPPNFFRQLVAAARYRPQAKTPECAITVIASEKDRLVSAECSRRLAQKWNCTLKLHPWAGHDLPLDDPQWLATAI